MKKTKKNHKLKIVLYKCGDTSTDVYWWHEHKNHLVYSGSSFTFNYLVPSTLVHLIKNFNAYKRRYK